MISKMEEKGLFKLIEVDDKAAIKEFLNFPSKLYKSDKHWIRPLDEDIEAVFDKSKNKNFRHGDAIRWLLKDQKQNTIGRVAAFYNEKTAKKNQQPTGAMGFFDCINNQQAADILFDACRSWLVEKGMEAWMAR